MRKKKRFEQAIREILASDELGPGDPVPWEEVDPPAPVSLQVGDTMLQEIRAYKHYEEVRTRLEEGLLKCELESPLLKHVETLFHTLCTTLTEEPLKLFLEYQAAAYEAIRVYHFIYYLEGKESVPNKRRKKGPGLSSFPARLRRERAERQVRRATQRLHPPTPRDTAAASSHAAAFLTRRSPSPPASDPPPSPAPASR